jgi:predicted nucleic acid-binding protein
MQTKKYLPIIIGIVALVALVYLLQFILQISFQNHGIDEIAVSLKPFQNHYFSPAKYFMTTEGHASELTNDPTAVGRFFSFLILGVVAWIVAAVVLYMIRSTRKHHYLFILAAAGMISAVAFYAAFFVPERAAEFSNGCRRAGAQGSQIDFLICSIAAGNSAAILTTDKDFSRYAKHLPIILHEARTRGVESH